MELVPGPIEEGTDCAFWNSKSIKFVSQLSLQTTTNMQIQNNLVPITGNRELMNLTSMNNKTQYNHR